jgi:hypothetical protein
MFVSMSSCNFTARQKTTVSVSFVISSGSDLIDVSGRRSQRVFPVFACSCVFGGFGSFAAEDLITCMLVLFLFFSCEEGKGQALCALHHRYKQALFGF